MSEEKRINTTGKDFQLFQEEFNKWKDLLGLKGWKIYFVHTELEDAFATISTNLTGRVATVSFNTTFNSYQYNEEQIKETAFHEALELFLARINALAHYRHTTKDEIDEELHNIIRILEDLKREHLPKDFFVFDRCKEHIKEVPNKVEEYLESATKADEEEVKSSREHITPAVLNIIELLNLEIKKDLDVRSSPPSQDYMEDLIDTSFKKVLRNLFDEPLPRHKRTIGAQKFFDDAVQAGVKEQLQDITNYMASELQIKIWESGSSVTEEIAGNISNSVMAAVKHVYSLD